MHKKVGDRTTLIDPALEEVRVNWPTDPVLPRSVTGNDIAASHTNSSLTFRAALTTVYLYYPKAKQQSLPQVAVIRIIVRPSVRLFIVWYNVNKNGRWLVKRKQIEMVEPGWQRI